MYRNIIAFSLIILDLLLCSCDIHDSIDDFVIEEIPINQDLILDDSISVSFSLYMSLDPSRSQSTAQGGACYGDYFIQGYNYNSTFDIYNLKEKSYVCQVLVPSVPNANRCHANTISFGTQKYQEDDLFPILYINSGYSLSSKSSTYLLYGYRLIEKKDSSGVSYEATLIQTINLIGFGVNKWVESFVDSNHNVFRIKHTYNNYQTFGWYPIPDVHREIVTINTVDIQDNFSVPSVDFISRNQGHFYYDDKIYIPSGVPSSAEKVCLIIINLQKNARECIIDLYDCGLRHSSNPYDNTFEPESIFYYNGKFMLAYRDRIYEITFENIQR